MSLNRRSWNLIYLIAIIALTIASGFLIYNPHKKEFNIKLGLDLRSGTHIALQLKPTKDEATGKFIKIDDAVISNTINIFGRRLNPEGNKEILIQREGSDKIIIEIPNETNVQKAEELIKKVGKLEFKELSVNYSTYEETWRTVLTGANLEKNGAKVDFHGPDPVVAFRLDKQGAKIFAEATRRNVGKPLGIFFDGVQISAPMVKDVIPGGLGTISGGSMDIKECEELTVLLNSGSLSVDVEILESMTVDPILGQESLNASMVAGLIGLLIVCIFMVCVYRLPGLLADIALIVYAVIVLASMQLGGFVLTLPGIAGIILSIGMAVDANVLIFERLKEELWEGKSLSKSISNGFHRAFSPILDSHVTTFIGAMILYIFGSTSIKGFGLTLMIGTFWSLITAVAFTRVFVDTLFLNDIAKKETLYGK